MTRVKGHPCWIGWTCSGVLNICLSVLQLQNKHLTKLPNLFNSISHAYGVTADHDCVAYSSTAEIFFTQQDQLHRVKSFNIMTTLL